MTTGTVNGGGKGLRSGAQTLTLLGAPLNSRVLRALMNGPKRQTELRKAAGSPAQTTLRAHLESLLGVGAIAKHRRNRFPGVLEFELTEAGESMTTVATTLERWLEDSPEGPLRLGTNAAKLAVKALVDGWSTSILRVLAARALTLTELDQIINSLSYPSLERRMSAMRASCQIEARPANDRGTPYGVTPWLRKAVAPLAAATRWERRHLDGRAPALTAIDAEATFLLAIPLLQLPSAVSGSCRMAIEVPNSREFRVAGVLVDVRDGRVTECATRLHGNPDAWAAGSTEAWLAALIDDDSESLELGGDGRLARTFLGGLHQALFATNRPAIALGT